jgi:hypothetical protein
MMAIGGVSEITFFKVENDEIVSEQKLAKDHLMSKDWKGEAQVTIIPGNIKDGYDKPYGGSGLSKGAIRFKQWQRRLYTGYYVFNIDELKTIISNYKQGKRDEDF